MNPTFPIEKDLSKLGINVKSFAGTFTVEIEYWLQFFSNLEVGNRPDGQTRDWLRKIILYTHVYLVGVYKA